MPTSSNKGAPSDTASQDSSNQQHGISDNNNNNDNRNGLTSRRLVWTLMAIIVALAVVLGVVTGILVQERKNHKQEEDGSGSVVHEEPVQVALEEVEVGEVDVEEVHVTTESPVGRLLSIEELQQLLVGQAEKLGFDVDAHDAKALRWTWSTQDPSTMSTERLIQRYALASLFFATGGEATVTGNSTTEIKWSGGTNWLVIDDECEWVGITCGTKGQILSLQLSQKNLVGTLPQELLYLQSSLQTLDLFSNPIYYSHDNEKGDWLRHMKSLTHLFYGQTNFTSLHGVPSSVGLLTNLIEYDCSYTKYSGPLLGESFALLSNLNYAVLSGNAYGSSVPTELASLPNLEYLYLQDNSLTGDLSFMISMANTSNSSKIVEFWMDNNPGVSGTIPSEVGLLTTLQSWSITNCSLTGSLPTELSNVPLKQFWCAPNAITGASVTSLEAVELSC